MRAGWSGGAAAARRLSGARCVSSGRVSSGSSSAGSAAPDAVQGGGPQARESKKSSEAVHTGEVTNVFFENATSTYGVMLCRESGKRIRFRARNCWKSRTGALKPGEEVRLEGIWTSHRTYGPQVTGTIQEDVAEERHISPRASNAEARSEIAAWVLELAQIKGVGRRTIEKMRQVLGDNLAATLASENTKWVQEQLSQVPYMQSESKKNIAKQWRKEDFEEVVDFSVRTQLNPAEFFKLIRHLKKSEDEAFNRGSDAQIRKTAMRMLEKNPYRFAMIPGVHFRMVDQVGVKFRAQNDPSRVAAAVRHAMGEALRNGDTHMDERSVHRAITELLGPDVDCDLALQRLANDSDTTKDFELVNEPARDLWFETQTWNQENTVVDQVIELEKIGPPVDAFGDIDSASVENFNLSKEQALGLEKLLTCKIGLLTGHAGTGKTHMLGALVKELGRRGMTFQLLAPTGRAAKQLSMFTGAEAMTIHRALKMQPGDTSGTLKNNEVRMVVVDEASMLDLSLAAALLRAIPREAQVIFVGDPAQLPSVSPGNVLRDLMRSETLCRVHLTENFRQTGDDNQIIRDATLVREGKLPRCLEQPVTRVDLSRAITDMENGEVIYCSINDAAEVVPTINDRIWPALVKRGMDCDEVQILSPRKDGETGVTNLNDAVRNVFNMQAFPEDERVRAFCDQVGFRPGDKVIQNKNDYAKDVFNGDFGRIQDVVDLSGRSVDDPEAKILVGDPTKALDFRVQFFPAQDALNPVTFSTEDMKRNVQLAFASTVHKAQGSQMGVVIVVLVRAEPHRAQQQ